MGNILVSARFWSMDAGLHEKTEFEMNPGKTTREG